MTMTGINTMGNAVQKHCRAAAGLLGAALALAPLTAHAQATRIPSASGLASTDATLPYTITPEAFVPFYTDSAGGNTLTFTDAGQAFYEVQQGGDYTGAFPDGTNLLATINSSGNAAGPLTITFASGVTEFGMSAQNAYFGLEMFTFTPYSGTTSLGTFTTGPLYNPGPTGLAFLGARVGSGSITSVVISSTSSQAGKSNITVVGPVTFGTAPGGVQMTLASSTFDTDADGWTAVDLPNDSGLTAPITQDGGPFTPTYNPGGGNPGGYISLADPDPNYYYWYAPAKFLHDKSAAFGGTFSFDMRDTNTGSLNAHEQSLILIGGGVTLTYTLAVPAATTFTHYTIPLAAVGFTNLNTGSPASDANMQTVLGALSSIYIEGDFEHGDDVSSLDNVLMTAPAAPVTVSSLTLSPTSVQGGAATSTGTITLTGPAPAGGLAVTQMSSDTTAATLDPTLNIPAGATSAQFTVTTSAVTSTKTVTILSSANGRSQSATLTVTAPPTVTVSSLTLSPTSVQGGAATSTGTITLTGPAPVGGLAITQFSSDTSAATLDPTLSIPAGATSAQFTVTTNPVFADKSVTILSAVNGTGKSATLTVTAPPAVTVQSLTLSPTSVVGGAATSTGTVTLSGPSPSGGLAVKQTSSDTTAATLAPTLNIPAGATSAKFKITTYAVSATKTVTITSSANGSSQTATLAVTGVAVPVTISALSLSPTSVKGGVATSTGTITLTGPAPASGLAVKQISSNTLAATLAPTLNIPAGATSAKFKITTYAVSSAQTVTIISSANGTSKTAALTVTH